MLEYCHHSTTNNVATAAVTAIQSRLFLISYCSLLVLPLHLSIPQRGHRPQPMKFSRRLQPAADVFLIRLLTEQEVLEEKDVPHLLKYQKAVGKRLIPLMRDANLIDEEEIVKSICETTGLQACPPGDFKIAKNVQGLMDTKTMSRFDAVPLKREGKAVFVAIPNPLDVSAFQQLREKLGTVVIPRVCTWSQYTSARYFLKGAKKTKTSAK